jgi:acyl carrier protein
MSERAEIVECFRAAALEILGKTFGEVADATPFEDLGLNSIDVVEIVTTLEDRLSLRFADDELERLRTVGELVDLVAQKRGLRAG